MPSTSKRPPIYPAKRHKTTTTTANVDTFLCKNPKRNSKLNSDLNAGVREFPTVPISFSQEDMILSHATHLTRPEVLRRRSHNLKQLTRCYKDCYWALMEELKNQHREYYWKFGVSPFGKMQKQEQENAATERESGETIITANVIGKNVNNSKGTILNLKDNDKCLANGCKSKVMALTSFCHLHILSDSKQKLYKPCDFVTWSAKAGSRTCRKPVLRSTVSSLCSIHYQKVQRDMQKTLRKLGMSTKVGFSVVVAEYVSESKPKQETREGEV